MTDLSTMSDADLVALYQQRSAAPAGNTPAGKAPADMSDEELMAAYQGGGQAQPINRFNLANPAPQAEETPALLEAARQREERDRPVTDQGTVGRFNRAAQAGVGNGLTLGFFNELASALTTPIELGIGAVNGEDDGKGIGQRLYDAYQRAYQKGQAEENNAHRANPAASIAGQVAGSVMTGGALQKAGVSLLNGAKPTATSIIGRGAAEGAIYGAVSGAGEDGSLKDRAINVAGGAGFGAGVGGGVGAAVSRGAKAQALRATAGPTSEEIATASQTLYKQAEELGVVLRPSAVNRLGETVRKAVADEGILPNVHPKANAALIALEEQAGKVMSFKDLERIRQVFTDVAGSADSAERRIAGILIDKLDDVVDKLNPGDFVRNAQNARAVVEMTKEARALWKTKMKSEIMDGLFYRAENAVGANYTEAGFATALRQQFKSIANNPAIMRRFSPDERTAILAVVRGAPAEKMLQRLGKLAPTGAISTMAGVGGGTMLLGPVGGVAVPMVGMAARNTVTRGVTNTANKARNLVRNRGVDKPLELSDGRRRVLEIGTRGGSTAAGRN